MLFDKSLVLLDAGMGKDLKMRGVEIPGTIWSANALVVAPDVVSDIHLENIRSGADVITTNTYGVIRGDLEKVGMEDRFEELNVIAGELARRAVATSGRAVKIAGSLPPLNGSYRPDRVMPFDVIAPAYWEHAEVLAPYVDVFLCETMSHTGEARAAAAGATATGLPTIVSFTLHDEPPARLRSGEHLEDALGALQEYPLAGVMVNCCLPERITEAIPTLSASGHEVVGGYANAFTHVPADWLLDGDKATDGSLALRDDLTPELYARFARDWLTSGATWIGGCCGTTALHTKALRGEMDTFQRR